VDVYTVISVGIKSKHELVKYTVIFLCHWMLVNW
jgi:hypothetical protein